MPCLMNIRSDTNFQEASQGDWEYELICWANAGLFVFLLKISFLGSNWKNSVEFNGFRILGMEISDAQKERDAILALRDAESRVNHSVSSTRRIHQPFRLSSSSRN